MREGLKQTPEKIYVPPLEVRAFVATHKPIYIFTLNTK